jgi:translocator protein
VEWTGIDIEVAHLMQGHRRMTENRAHEKSRQKPRSVLALFVFLGVCLGAGGLGAVATTPEIDGWYRTLAKPEWNPPNEVFGPVWTALFVLMAIAGWLVWQKEHSGPRRVGLILFGLQLALNVAWSWIFFALHQPEWAVIEIVLLWLAIFATLVVFLRQSRPAGALLVPYLTWVTFAAGLNFAIWRLNAAGGT